MYQEVIVFLREARAAALDEKDAGGNSRELSVALTHIDTAILWVQEDLRLKAPTIDECNDGKER